MKKLRAAAFAFAAAAMFIAPIAHAQSDDVVAKIPKVTHIVFGEHLIVGETEKPDGSVIVIRMPSVFRAQVQARANYWSELGSSGDAL